MCGIAGYVQRRDSTPADIARMTHRLAHRGPDGSGTWSADFGEWSVALGHRRLSIIDIAGGHQPMGTDDGSHQITYNGEVYNFRELRADLERAGRRFHTRCDTEVVLHHCIEHGPDGLDELDGMFAFGLWDAAAQTLLLARDRVGIKPLYYAPLSDGGMAFASELSALLEHPGVDRRLDPSGAASLFFSDYAHAPSAIVRGARKLEPGHYLLWSARDGLSRPMPFWSLRLDESQTLPDESDLPLQLRSMLQRNVEAQLVADVPVGVFLSGGIDSSLVAALAARVAHRRIQTFSIGFEDPDFDESQHARVVAQHIGSEHIEERFSETTLLDTLDEALNCLDEPMADPSVLPTFLLSRVAAKHVKVALGGDGGDELWAGYPTYQAHLHAAMYRRVPELVRTHVIDPVVARLPVREGYQSFEWKAKRFALRWDDELSLRHLRWMSNTDLPDLQSILCERAQPPQVSSEPIACGDGEDDPINRVLALDFSTYLPGSVLTKVDRASMAHGLEVRPPMLANALIDFAFSLPSHVKMRGTITKYLLKSAATGVIPARIVHRRKKGFAIPLARWIRGPLLSRLEQILASSPLWDVNLLRRETFEKWLDQHRRRTIDRSRPLWALLVLDHWMHRNGITPAL